MDGAVRQLEIGADAEESTAAPSMGGREQAFSALVDRHARLLYRVAYSLLRNAEDAEDAVQETLLKLFRTGGWVGMKDERAFLARAVWRVGLDRLASGSSKAMRYAEDSAELDLASPELTPEQQALGAADRRLMARLIEELPEEFRQALLLNAIEEMRAHEVARILGVAEATVRTRVMRAKVELRRRYLALTAPPNAEQARRKEARS